ncbi:MAG TPA: DUF3300 domain-containing protein [Terriglobales bacterium]|nr:DUF3300 domain-containing protein [Terriglobales bacterium]
MNIFGRAAGFSRFRSGQQILASVLSLALLFATLPQSLPAQDAPAAEPAPAAPAYAQQTPEQLQRLVAPIALYPDSLVAQILAASTFPEEVVEADRWVQDHPDLKGDALGKAVDEQPWDPSVKALTTFPSVLGNMDKNLSWTSTLGDAYYNQQQDVMDAVQVMRHKAEQAGALKNPQHEVIKQDGPDIDIEPAEPDVVYVPAYNPWLIYGYPIVAWPGWYPYPGIWFGGPYFSFGLGFGIGWFGGFGWGWGHWGFDWHNRYAMFGGGRYFSRSRTFYNRGNFSRGGGVRGGVNNRAGAAARPFNGNRQAARGYAEPRGQSGTRSGAFSGYDHGGQAKSYSSRGSASMGARGGGAARGGGGGGARGGGGRR